MRFKTPNPALLIIDVQHAIDNPLWGTRNNSDAEKRMAELLACWREKQLPLFHVRHSSTESNSTYRPNQSGFAFKPEVTPKPSETVITKHVHSAFAGTDLNEHLENANISELVICGVITNNSVDATIRSAHNLGYSVFAPEDAIFTFELKARNNKIYSAEEIHAIFLANLDGEYAHIVRTTDIITAAKKNHV